MVEITYGGLEFESEATSRFPETAAVRKGCIWSPLLFTMLIESGY